MHAGSRQIVVQVGDIHPHDPGSLPFQPYIHRIAIRKRGQVRDTFRFAQDHETNYYSWGTEAPNSQVPHVDRRESP